MSDEEFNLPPPEAEGDDRPSDNEDALDDTAEPFQPGAGGDDSDDESLLSEVDEAQFADFDPSAVAPDFETLNKSIKIGKRKRTEGEGGPPKKKEKTRDKPKKSRRRKDDSDDGFEGGEELEGKRRRKSKAIVTRDGKRRAPAQPEVDDESLDPEERRRRALDRAIDAAVKNRTQRRVKKGDIVRFAKHVYRLASLTVLSYRTWRRWQMLRSKRCATA